MRSRRTRRDKPPLSLNCKKTPQGPGEGNHIAGTAECCPSHGARILTSSMSTRTGRRIGNAAGPLDLRSGIILSKYLTLYSIPLSGAVCRTKDTDRNRVLWRPSCSMVRFSRSVTRDNASRRIGTIALKSRGLRGSGVRSIARSSTPWTDMGRAKTRILGMNDTAWINDCEKIWHS
jgi:hypothetical protein